MTDILFCLNCRCKRLFVDASCQSCGKECGVMAWQCKRCSRVVRGATPDGPLVCGECPEERVSAIDLIRFTGENGEPVPGINIDTCKECLRPIWRSESSKLPKGAARCMECALGKTLNCGHPNHRGDRKTLAHNAQRGIYIHKTKAGQIYRRDDTLCFACFDRAKAEFPSEAASAPLLALIPEVPFALESSPRDRYQREAVIFDRDGVEALDEKRVVRFSDASVKTTIYKGKDVRWLECEEIRDGVPRESVTFNKRVVATIGRIVEEKRKARNLFLREHQSSRAAQYSGPITIASLGWVLITCHSLVDGKPQFSVTYPDLSGMATTLEWARKALNG